MMTFPDAVRTCLSKYATFSGRAARSEYWYFVLFAVLVFFAAFILDGVLNLLLLVPAMGGNVLVDVTVLFLLIPHIAVAVRRLHDLGHSGWWYLIGFIPFVGGMILVILFCFQGTTGENRFGPDPLAFDADWAPENS